MNIQEYFEERKRIFSKQTVNVECDNLLWASNSLFGEGGEYANFVKKVYRDHGMTINSMMLNDMVLELGDFVWYWVFCCECANIDPKTIVEKISFKASYVIRNDSVMLASNAFGSKIGEFQEAVNYIWTVNNQKINDETTKILFSKLHSLIVCFLRICETLKIDSEMVFEINCDKLKKVYNIK